MNRIQVTVNEFVDYWKEFYHDNVPIVTDDGDVQNEIINYIDEIHIENDLTDENIKRLLRWKDPARRRHVYLTGERRGDPNPNVNAVMAASLQMNIFRNADDEDEQAEQEFRDVTGLIFAGGTVLRAFLFHICKPWKYPIIDQHSARAADYLTENQYSFEIYFKERNLEVNWGLFQTYRLFFFNIVQQCFANIGDDHRNRQYVESLKQVDNALFAFGKFLKGHQDLGLLPA